MCATNIWTLAVASTLVLIAITDIVAVSGQEQQDQPIDSQSFHAVDARPQVIKCSPE